MTAAPRKNYLNLILGIGFLSYGSYRIYTFLTGAEYTTFRIIVAIGFIILGVFDLYKFFRKDSEV